MNKHKSDEAGFHCPFCKEPIEKLLVGLSKTCLGFYKDGFIEEHDSEETEVVDYACSECGEDLFKEGEYDPDEVLDGTVKLKAPASKNEQGAQ